MQYFPLEMPLKDGVFSTTDASYEPFHLSWIELSPAGSHNEGESLLQGSAMLSCLEDLVYSLVSGPAASLDATWAQHRVSPLLFDPYY